MSVYQQKADWGRDKHSEDLRIAIRSFTEERRVREEVMYFYFCLVLGEGPREGGRRSPSLPPLKSSDSFVSRRAESNGPLFGLFWKLFKKVACFYGKVR